MIVERIVKHAVCDRCSKEFQTDHVTRLPRGTVIHGDTIMEDRDYCNGCMLFIFKVTAPDVPAPKVHSQIDH